MSLEYSRHVRHLEVRQDPMNDFNRMINTARTVVIAIAVALTVRPSLAQFQTNVYSPPEADRAALVESCDHLRKEVAALRSQSAATRRPDAHLLPDIEI